MSLSASLSLLLSLCISLRLSVPLCTSLSVSHYPSIFLLYSGFRYINFYLLQYPDNLKTRIKNVFNNFQGHPLVRELSKKIEAIRAKEKLRHKLTGKSTQIQLTGLLIKGPFYRDGSIPRTPFFRKFSFAIYYNRKWLFLRKRHFFELGSHGSVKERINGLMGQLG